MFDNILDVSLAHGMAVKLAMTPDNLLPHPKNCGGRMVVASEVEHKGALIVEQGAKLKLIGHSVAFELPSEGERTSIWRRFRS